MSPNTNRSKNSREYRKFSITNNHISYNRMRYSPLPISSTHWVREEREKIKNEE